MSPPYPQELCVSTKDPYYVVHTGDATRYFKFGKRYRLSYLRGVLNDRITACVSCTHPIELFPGLVLEAPDGQLLKPEIQVRLVPVEPEK